MSKVLVGSPAQEAAMMARTGLTVWEFMSLAHTAGCREDFTTWEGVGLDGILSVDGSTVNFVDLLRQTTDKTVRLTNQTLPVIAEYSFQFSLASMTLPAADRNLITLFGNNVAGEQFGLEFRFDAADWYVRLQGATSNDDSVDLNTLTTYFVTMNRNATAIQAIIRTGSQTGTIIDTLTALTAAGELTVTRHVGLHNQEFPDGTAKATGQISELCLSGG